MHPPAGRTADKDIDIGKVTPGARVALRNDSYTLHVLLPTKVDPLVSLMKVGGVGRGAAGRSAQWGARGRLGGAFSGGGCPVPCEACPCDMTAVAAAPSMRLANARSRRRRGPGLWWVGWRVCREDARRAPRRTRAALCAAPRTMHIAAAERASMVLWHSPHFAAPPCHVAPSISDAVRAADPSCPHRVPQVEKVPDSTYDMVGGLDQQIKEIKEVRLGEGA